MPLFSNRRWVGGASVTVGAWLVLGACNGSPVGVVDDDSGADGSGDAVFETSGDTTLDVGPEGSGNDGSNDGTMMSSEASSDANEGGAAETGTSDAGLDAGADTGSTQDASSDASSDTGGGDAASEAESDAEVEAGIDAPAEAATDAGADAPLEAAPCTFAGSWSMTVQTVTAVPTFCQGVMDCTNCGVLFTATSTQPSATTIDWNVDPGGVLCTAFSGNITAAGQFTTNETNCSPAGNGSTFNGQIDLPTCSMTATYVYVLSNCTITETMTGIE